MFPLCYWETQKRDNEYHTFSIKHLSTILQALQITLCNWCFWILELFRKTDHFKCHRNHEMTMATRKRQNFSYICVCLSLCVHVGAKSVAWIPEVREKGAAETSNGSASCPSSQSPGGSRPARWHPPRSESERSEEMVDPMLSIRIRSISWDPCSCSSLLFRNLCSRSRFSSWCWLLLSVSSSFWHDQIWLSKRFHSFSPSLPPPLSDHLLYFDIPRSQKDLSCKRALKQAAFLSPGVVLPPHNSSRSQALINHTCCYQKALKTASPEETTGCVAFCGSFCLSSAPCITASAHKGASSPLPKAARRYNHHIKTCPGSCVPCCMV